MTPKNFVVILTIFGGLMLAGCAFNQPDGETQLLGRCQLAADGSTAVVLVRQ